MLGLSPTSTILRHSVDKTRATLVLIANFEDNWRDSVGLFRLMSPATCRRDTMTFPGARLLDSARKASASLTIAAATGWRFL